MDELYTPIAQNSGILGHLVCAFIECNENHLPCLKAFALFICLKEIHLVKCLEVVFAVNVY